jgi:hypothetical protein
MQILLANSQFGAFFLLYQHHGGAKCCSMRIQKMVGPALFYHIGGLSNAIGLHDLTRAAHAIF